VIIPVNEERQALRGASEESEGAPVRIIEIEGDCREGGMIIVPAGMSGQLPESDEPVVLGMKIGIIEHDAGSGSGAGIRADPRDMTKEVDQRQHLHETSTVEP
jgi:hypothetical protein